MLAMQAVAALEDCCTARAFLFCLARRMQLLSVLAGVVGVLTQTGMAPKAGTQHSWASRPSVEAVLAQAIRRALAKAQVLAGQVVALADSSRRRITLAPPEPPVRAAKATLEAMGEALAISWAAVAVVPLRQESRQVQALPVLVAADVL